MKVTTTHKTAPNGRPQIVAKSNGKQATHNVDLSKSEDWNHGTAAGALLVKMGFGRRMALNPMTHTVESNADKTRHTFTVEG
jgi:hypothetical protein